MKKQILLFCLLFVSSFSFSQSLNIANNNGDANYNSQKDSIAIIALNNGDTWGYDILVNGSLFVHQRTIPAVPETSGYKTKQYAIKTAELVVDKIKHGIIPPTITKGS